MNIVNKTMIVLMIAAVIAPLSWASGPFPNLKLRKQQLRKINPSVIYVNQNSRAHSPDGSSWSTAYPSLSQALACDHTHKKEIWVAKGTYYPTMDANRKASFLLIPGISLFGGFQGNELLRSQRDWTRNTTVLSGEIGDPSRMTDNSLHVVTGSDDAVIDGFTIRDGYAVLTGQETDDSGSLVAVPGGTEPVEILDRVTNRRSSYGGGLLNVHAGTLTRNCCFLNNYAAKGGAVYNMVTRSWNPDSPENTLSGQLPVFENCIFEDNHARDRGGAVTNDFFTASTFMNCIFSNNSCEAEGGALYADMGSPVYLMNVLFCHNEAERGAALVAEGASSHRMVYTTFVGNMAYDIGAALYQGTYRNDQTDGQPFKGNEVHLYRSIVISNISISSATSISSWHDARATYDVDSIVEPLDGTLQLSEYLEEKNYYSKSRDAGFHPGRKIDMEYWTDVFDRNENRIYTGYVYDTTTSTNPSGSGCIRYVDDDASGGGDGTSWKTAYADLNQALDQAVSGDQIWVARGRYLPTSGQDRTAAFVMKKGVSILGGFKGIESRLEQRDIENNATVLSGDIGTADDDTDNSYHVVFGAPDSLLDGFVIQDGRADGDFHHSRGGGLLCDNHASPRILNCTFKKNQAKEGGAIACTRDSSPIIENCTVTQNTARSGGAFLFRTGPGGSDPGPKLTAVDLIDNTAQDRGGAVYIDYGAGPNFFKCTLTGNTVIGNGGGVYVDSNASPLFPIETRFDTCLLKDNTAGLRGGGFAVYEGTVFLNNTIVTDNTAASGGVGIALEYTGRVVNEKNSSTVTVNTSISGRGDIDNLTQELTMDLSQATALTKTK
jgi:predicted outer membrane repeat protein